MKEIQLNTIKGIQIGHAQNEDAATGCTVILAKDGVCAGVDVRGGGPATRETDLLNPVNMIEKIHAVMLSGGSAFGLDAGSGAMQYLEEQGCGFDTGVAKVPIVCGASLFDLAVGSAHIRPDKAMGYEACVNSETNNPLQGNVGAGTGATVGKMMGPAFAMKSGIGMYAVEVGNIQVGAIVAVNAVGDVVENDQVIAGIYNKELKQIISTEEAMLKQIEKAYEASIGNTTIGCIITNAKITKAQATKISSIAHNGYARSIRPVHTMNDGDTIFTLGTGEVEANVDVIGALASTVMAQAVLRAVKNSEGAYGLCAYKDICKENM